MTEAQVRLRLIPYNARLIDARKSKGWTQKDMALLTGFSTAYLGHIETLRVIPSKAAMDEIAGALNLSKDYLFPEALIGSMKDGLFDHRVAELQEQDIVRLTEARRAGLLPPGITEDEALESIEREIDRELLKRQLPEVLSSLTPREQRVLELRFGLRDGRSRTLEQVGREFNVTGESIRRIEAKALRKLRHPSRSRRLKDFLGGEL